MQEINSEIHMLCQRYQALAISQDEQQLTIALQGEVPTSLLNALRFATGKNIVVQQWSQARLEQQLSRHSELRRNPEHTGGMPAAEPVISESYSDREASLNDQSDTPVVQFINQTLRSAIQRRASDVHFEPYPQTLRVRLRIDGVLQTISSPSLSLAAPITARLKIMAQLDIAERRLPQDGQLSVQLDNTHFSMRISTLPTLHGEKVVLRILQTSNQELPLEQLGMREAELACFTRILASPQGMILVTGPTGSGKTVTLYSGLRQLNNAQRNLCSVEDPIEIPVFGINQTQINSKTDLDFARVLRALLRQDPDVIMIGEIRDTETAEIAVKAAQTGHLVLSTLHTNSSCETLTRLTQMGIPGYQLAACLKLVIAQRLVRRLCPHCRRQHPQANHFPAAIWPTPLLAWQAVGCEQCFAGYYGRTGIYEFLTITPTVQTALIENATLLTLAEVAQQQGQVSLLQSGLALAAQGITSLEEVYRVVGSHAEAGLAT
ncbi:type II secretion system protein GspE [Serratia microhaemolytica]|uniref:type II secretion system protein GspE n=1 Tax=Serratia microhaemolytica TaxID=2675110 RepID=UPI000FDDB056|nr:type II secretion system protein GspE [Serratia microhaemolytica]